MIRSVQFSTGVPPLSAFRSGGNSPLLVDTTTSIGYYADPLTGAITALAGAGGSGTVTHTAGNLDAGLVIVGNGTADVKTLAASTDGFVLTQVAGIAAWVAPAAGGVTLGQVVAQTFLPITT